MGLDPNNVGGHWDSTRSVVFLSRCGPINRLQTDYKLLCRQSPKKVTAAIFSNDSSLVVFADKFGDVLTAKLQPGQSQEGSAAPLLGHLCSIVTSLAFTPDGKQLVSTDQDCKVRVSTMPAEPQQVRLITFFLPHCMGAQWTAGACITCQAENTLTWCGPEMMRACCRVLTQFRAFAWDIQCLQNAAPSFHTEMGLSHCCCLVVATAPSGAPSIVSFIYLVLKVV